MFRKKKLLGQFPVEELGRAGDLYMVRWHMTPWKKWPFEKRLYLHCFHRPDSPHEAPHDHPFPFRSIILWGGYVERLWAWYEPQIGPKRWLYKDVRRTLWTSHVAPAECVHKVQELLSDKVWTLVIRTPKMQEWGFYPEIDGKVDKVLWWRYLGMSEKPPAAYGEVD